MKKTMLIYKVLLLCMTTGILQAQKPSLQYFRLNDKRGINIFETPKNDSIPFEGFKLRIGGNFALAFQALRNQNNATPVVDSAGTNINELRKLTDGFNFPMANLNIDVQLGDGIRLNLTMYLSTRRHRDTWVKGGYIQFDKLAFLKSNFIDSVMKNVTIKMGELEVDYGDQHFRRSDGGNTVFNPFIENYIMDEFATEIGGEIYYHSKGGVLAMGGITNGQLDNTVTASTEIDSATGKLNKYYPALHAKIGYDKQVNNDFRIRITGSIYTIKSTEENFLYSGDRAGSHYFWVMENTMAVFNDDEDFDDNSWSGRYDPLFPEQVTTFMINSFIKFKGLEFFGTYEMARGRIITEKDLRKATQYAVDLIYRFPADKENFWIGARYNSLTATLPFNPTDVTINRIVGSVGWFLTKNIMLKGEYVNQLYKNFPADDIRSGGKFNGWMMETSVAF